MYTDPNSGGHNAALQWKMFEISLNFGVVFKWFMLVKSNYSYEDTKNVENDVSEDVIID